MHFQAPTLVINIDRCIATGVLCFALRLATHNASQSERLLGAWLENCLAAGRGNEGILKVRISIPSHNVRPGQDRVHHLIHVTFGSGL